ncbi:beta-L-arabinofuranosidase domain-containing protein [Paenibacillus sp. FSL R10-2734]|uniref:beta-L-arabinofuranosidase domain-containing protein n=1 Tax=Paenibacillus sp. FSL R10-2734 TaxID=2954691 RepID=UPI0030D9509C
MNGLTTNLTKAFEILEEDIAAMYLGNLKTVEFDLTLPTEGKNGSKIAWKSADDRWINGEGVVNRPPYGRGNRVVKLTATFSYRDAQQDKVYDVRILEAPNDIQVAHIFPVVLEEKVGTPFYLPSDIAVRTQEGNNVSHRVEWSDEQPLVFHETGSKTAIGVIQGTDYQLTADIHIKEQVKRIKERPVQMSYFPLSAIRLTTDSSMKQAQDQRLQFLLSVNDDQMLYNFRKASGIDTQDAPEMIGWDSPDSLLRGHTTGHYLSALALAYQSTGNAQILSKLTYMIDKLDKVQLAFEAQPEFQYGFISGYSEEQFDLLEQYRPYPEIWAPYYTLHKIFAGLLDSYSLAGLEKALNIADKLGDWTYNRLNRLTHKHRTQMWAMYIAGEYGGMNDALAELYLYTQKSEHLAAAKMFDNDRLFFPMKQKIDAIGGLHANQHIPQIVGTMKMYEASKEDEYYQISKFFWDVVTESHIYAMGGTGDGEMFQYPDHIANHISKNTAETCASYNMLKLTKMLYSYDTNPRYLDYYEQTMLNHILATPDHDCGGESTYFMASQPGAQRFFEVENSCCHGTGMENHFKYGELLYSYDDTSLYINFFASAKLNDTGTGIQCEVLADEAEPETATIRVQQLAGRVVKVRKPAWSTQLTFADAKGSVEVKLLDGFYELPAIEGEISVTFEAAFRVVATPDDSSIFAIYYGPYLLAALSDQKDYLELDVNQENVNQKMKKLSGSKCYQYEDTLKFMPVHLLDDEHYHMYVKELIK